MTRSHAEHRIQVAVVNTLRPCLVAEWAARIAGADAYRSFADRLIAEMQAEDEE